MADSYENDPAYQAYLEEKWAGDARFEAQQEAGFLTFAENCGEPDDYSLFGGAA